MGDTRRRGEPAIANTTRLTGLTGSAPFPIAANCEAFEITATDTDGTLVRGIKWTGPTGQKWELQTHPTEGHLIASVRCSDDSPRFFSREDSERLVETWGLRSAAAWLADG